METFCASINYFIWKRINFPCAFYTQKFRIVNLTHSAPVQSVPVPNRSFCPCHFIFGPLFDNVVPCRRILIFFSIFSSHCIRVLTSAEAAGYISQSNKQEGQITYHSNSNSKVVELQKLLLCESRKC